MVCKDKCFRYIQNRIRATCETFIWNMFYIFFFPYFFERIIFLNFIFKICPSSNKCFTPRSFSRDSPHFMTEKVHLIFYSSSICVGNFHFDQATFQSDSYTFTQVWFLVTFCELFCNQQVAHLFPLDVCKNMSKYEKRERKIKQHIIERYLWEKVQLQ